MISEAKICSDIFLALNFRMISEAKIVFEVMGAFGYD